jgi:hypothetical protein
MTAASSFRAVVASYDKLADRYLATICGADMSSGPAPDPSGPRQLKRAQERQLSRPIAHLQLELGW